jgi:hypothetical protein
VIKQELRIIKDQEALILQEPFRTQLKRTAEEDLRRLRAKNASPEEIDKYLETIKRQLASKIQAPWRKAFRDGAAERLRELKAKNASPEVIMQELAAIKEQDTHLAQAEKAMIDSYLSEARKRKV